MPREIKITYWAVLAACVAVAVMSFMASVGKIYTLDEALLATRAHMVLEMGLKGPQIALGEEGFTHPPFYELMLTLLFRLFGEKDVVGRAFGIVNYIFVGCLLFFLIVKLSEKKDRVFLKTAGIVFACLYLTNPLVIQHAMLIDSETGLVFPIATIFVVLYALAERYEGRKWFLSRLVLGAIFAAVFFAKEVTPFFLMAAVVAYRLINCDFRKLLFDLLGILLPGLILIFAGFIGYKAITGENMEFFLHKQYGFRTARVLSLDFLMRVLRHLPMIVRWPIFWATAPLHFLAFYALLRRMRMRFREGVRSIEDYLWISVLAVWLPYLLVKPSIDMMKFHHTVYPWIMVGVSLAMASAVSKKKEILRAIFKKQGKIIVPAAMVLMATTVYYYHCTGDYILSLSLPGHSKIWNDFLVHYFWPIGAVSVVFFLLFTGIRKIALLTAFIFMSVSIGIALDLRQTAPYTTVESWLNYGERGMRETVESLLSKNLDGKNISTRSDIHYYLRRRQGVVLKANIETPHLFSLTDPLERVRMLREKAFDCIVIDKVSRVYVRMDTPMGKEVSDNYRIENIFGDFMILVPKRAKELD